MWCLQEVVGKTVNQGHCNGYQRQYVVELFLPVCRCAAAAVVVDVVAVVAVAVIVVAALVYAAAAVVVDVVGVVAVAVFAVAALVYVVVARWHLEGKHWTARGGQGWVPTIRKGIWVA